MKKARKGKLVAACMCAAALTVAAVGGTFAYLQDTDSDVNVMTLGNVKIEQIEQERAEDGELQAFTQAKPLYPAVYEGDSIPWADAADWAVANDAAWKTVETYEGDNVVDKFVTVENTGSSAAYVRTIIAYEGDAINGQDIHIVQNAQDSSDSNVKAAFAATDYIENVEVNGTRYDVIVYTYATALEPGETTIPSLKQVYMDKGCSNDDVAKYGEAYDILVLSQAVQTEGFGGAVDALNAAFGDPSEKAAQWFAGEEFIAPVLVTTAEELKTALEAAGAAKAGDTNIVLGANVNMEGVTWTPIKVDGYHGAGVITFDGGDHVITNLTAPLFDGGFAGESGIVIKNLTIADSNIVSNGTQGAGAFINCVDSMETIVLEDCHLINSTVYAPNARTGGLIGWTSGYSNQNDGPVKTYITISDCSVIGSKITGTAVGGINGHAGASDWTYTTISNCTVMNNVLTSTDDGGWRVGAVIGTANVGEVVINNVTAGGNEMTQNEGSVPKTCYDEYEFVGRFVPGDTGKLIINGAKAITLVNTAEGMNAALEDGKPIMMTNDVKFSSPISNDANINLAGNTFEATSTINLGNNADLSMTDGDYVVNSTYGHIDVRPDSVEGSVVVFENIDFSFNKLNKTNGPSTNRLGTVVEVCATAADAHTEIVFRNCTFYNAQVLFEGMSGKTGTFEATFENCTFNCLTSSAPIYVQNYVKGTLNVVGCTFNMEVTSKSASAISISSSSSTSVILNAENNTINAVAATPYTYDAAKGETEENNVKVNGTPANIKFVSCYENTTVNETGTVATGIAIV